MAKHDDGSGIISYDSFEEMLADQRRAHDEAMANMTPSQRTILVGGYACNVNHLADFGPIFGCIQSEAEVRAWHELYYGVGNPARARAALAVRGEFEPPSYPKDPAQHAWLEDGFASGEDAVADAVRRHLDSWINGYLFGTWLSNLEPAGELGSAHAAVCVPITREVWLDAKAHGGYVTTSSADQIAKAMRVVQAEYQAREEHKAREDKETEGGGDGPGH